MNLYELLSVDPSADRDAIKKAFRQQIARYHPDKVLHLGREFQELAELRSAQLTEAYRTLTDPDSRMKYDASLEGGTDHVAIVTPAAGHRESTRVPAEAPTDPAEPHHAESSRHFEKERAGRDDIMRRAMLGRVADALRHLLGQYDAPAARGFDLVCVPRTTQALRLDRLRRRVRPAVLVKTGAVVDGALTSEAWRHAVRLQLDPATACVVLLLLGDRVATAGELLHAIERARYMSPTRQDRIYTVALNLNDWSAAPSCEDPVDVRTFIDELRALMMSRQPF